ncbi:MAG: hypothetical protein H7A51_04905 [Akkermansiaceae bacterium]|nr:hypothetical protein [Akkermansiaceae bacterium]
MKAILYTILVLGALMLPASRGVRIAAISLLKSVAAGIERMVIRGDYAEVRMVDADEFDQVINEPGRIVIVVIQNELTASSRGETHDLDEEIKRLPAKVLVAKVIAERNTSLLEKLNVPAVPNVRIYKDGRMMREFRGKVDKSEFINTVNGYLKHVDSVGSGSGYIGPMDENWMPEGVQEKQSKPKAPVGRLK